MDAYERQLMTRVVNDLLRQPDPLKDVDAERALAMLVSSRSDATYLLLQRTLVLEAALEQVQWQMQRLREAQAVEQGAALALPAAAAQPVRPGAPAASAMSAPHGFLRDAAVISAGVVGGSLLVRGVESLFDEDTDGAQADGFDIGLG